MKLEGLADVRRGHSHSVFLRVVATPCGRHRREASLGAEK
jgi:hypothetical protein